MPAIARTTLRAGELLCRPFRPGDRAGVLAACRDPLIARYIPVPEPYTEADARRYVEETTPEGWATGTAATFAVVGAEDAPDAADRLLASVGLHFRGRDPGIAELGYWCAPWARGGGVVPRAAAAVCRWGFAGLAAAGDRAAGRPPIERIEWFAEVGNDASRRVAEKLGFRMEGLLRSYLCHRDRRVDAWVASLLPGELAA